MSNRPATLVISLAICTLLARGGGGAERPGPLAPRAPVAMPAPRVYRLPALQTPRSAQESNGPRYGPALRPPARVQPAAPSGQMRQTAIVQSSPQYVLTLPQAFELALTQNPLVVAQRAAEGVGVAAIGVARRYPFNPFFQFQATPIQKAPASATAIEPNAATKIYQYYLVMVNFELAHQRRYRERNATAALSNVRWTIQQTELQSLALTEQLYFTALYRRGLRDVARANAELNGSLLSILERQLDAGQASAADVAMVRLDARSTVQVLRLAETNYQTALLDLGRQLNLPPSAPLQLAGELQDWRWMPATGEHLSRVVGLRSVISNTADVETIAAELAAGRPDVLAAQANIAAAQASISLARADRLPTLQFGPYYQSDDFGIKYYGFRGQVQQGALNGGKPLVRQRQAETRQQRITYEQLRARAKLEALTAIDRYERARRLVEETGAEAQFDVPIELKKLEEQFVAGEVDALRIFNARSSLVRLQQAYLDTLNEAAQAASLVTLATGLPPDALVQGVVRETLPPLPPPSFPGR
ncbi:MAG TPA: TolC family protein [Pirellulales bacterium]|nr:TolC family protein [Pirellulales bacterium]